MDDSTETNTGDVASLLSRIRGLGLDAFAEVVVRRCGRLLDLAAAPASEDETRRRALAQERATWPALLAALEEAMGRTPPLVQLAEVLALEPVERELITVLWGMARSDALARRTRDLAAAPGAGAGISAGAGAGVPAGMVVQAVFPDRLARRQAWHALRPQGVLRRRRLVRVALDEPARRASIELDPEITAFLDGVWHVPAGAVDAVRGRGHAGGIDGLVGPALPETPETPETRDIVHKPVLARVRALLAPPAAHVALVGRAGAGKRTLARAAAARLQRPIIEVRLGALPRDDDGRADVLARCARDALLYQAVLYVELDHERSAAWAAGHAVESTVAALAAHPGRLVVGVPAEPLSSLAAGVRAALPAMVAMDVPEVRPAVQPALWGQLWRARLHAATDEPSAWLAGMLTEPTEEALEAHACRHGLVIGDMVRALDVALAQLDAGAHGDALAAALGTALSEHLARDLAPLAERLWPPAMPAMPATTPATPAAPPAPHDPAWAALAAAVRGGRLEVDPWGTSTRTSRRPYPLVVQIAGIPQDQVAAAARFLAHTANMPSYRADLAYLAYSAHLAEAEAIDILDRLFAAAARCGAILLLTPITALDLDRPHARALANALGTCLEQADIPVLLHDPGPIAALPVAIASRIERALTPAHG